MNRPQQQGIRPFPQTPGEAGFARREVVGGVVVFIVLLALAAAEMQRTRGRTCGAACDACGDLPSLILTNWAAAQSTNVPGAW
jgi:hypothetical protein